MIARRTIQQVVAAERSEFLGEVLKIAGANVNNLGMTLVDVRVKRIELPEEVSESVFNRMRQDFARQAAQLRAEGSAMSEQHARRSRPPAHRDPRRAPIARRRSSRARATRRPRTSTRKAYGRNAEFYSFYRGLQAYRRSLGKQGDVLVIAPDGEFFKYLKDIRRADRGRPSTAMDWNDLWAAFALYLVLEGLMPFLESRRHEAHAAGAVAMEEQHVAPDRPRQHDRGLRRCSTSCAAAVC